MFENGFSSVRETIKNILLGENEENLWNGESANTLFSKSSREMEKKEENAKIMPEEEKRFLIEVSLCVCGERRYGHCDELGR